MNVSKCYIYFLLMRWQLLRLQGLFSIFTMGSQTLITHCRGQIVTQTKYIPRDHCLDSADSRSRQRSKIAAVVVVKSRGCLTFAAHFRTVLLADLHQTAMLLENRTFSDSIKASVKSWKPFVLNISGKPNLRIENRERRANICENRHVSDSRIGTTCL